MTDQESQLPQVWTPAKFDVGTDLLPTNALALQPEVEGVPIVGRDSIEQEDMILPSLRLLQGMSQEVTGAVEGAQPGKFWHSGTQQVFAAPLRVLLVAHMRGNALFPKPDDHRYNGLERCLSRDGVRGSKYGLCEECRKCLDWEDNRPPLGSQTHSFVVMSELGPCVLRFSRTSYKAAKTFLTAWNTSNKNLWAHPIVVRVEQHQRMLSTGAKATYYSMALSWQLKERVPDEAQRAAYKLHTEIMAAHEAGRFGSDEDEVADKGSVPF